MTISNKFNTHRAGIVVDAKKICDKCGGTLRYASDNSCVRCRYMRDMLKHAAPRFIKLRRNVEKRLELKKIESEIYDY